MYKMQILYKQLSCYGDSMIKLTIDGKKIIAKENQTILEAAIENGIYIPNLCYHPNLRPIGGCRLCIVEIKGIKGFPISCYNKVAEGMIVKTDTKKLQQLRQNLIWLILSNYPKDIPLSSQLKKVVDYIGVENILLRYVNTSRDLPIFSDDPLFVRDLNRCILCGRCVRVCQEVRGVGAIGLINRGIETFVGTGNTSSLKDNECKFCRACVEVCPSGALTDKEEIKEDEREEKLIPCKSNCPAGTDIPRYVRLIAEGRFQDSIEVIRQKFPFPHTLGLVCHHPCEEGCSRSEINEPISIRELKRFVAENDTREWKNKIKIGKNTGKKVAIIGSGPSGLTAAWFLRIKGHDVTVFDMLTKPGGMLKAGIPDYRLPPEVLKKEIKDITDVGVKIECNKKIDSIDKLFKQGFNAIYLALGAPKGIKMGIDGEDDPKVLDGITTLKNISFKEKVDIKGFVGVIGGGNVAIDVARSSLRIGAKKVIVIYRRTKAEMPAYKHEIEDAIDEGVEIMYLTNPLKIVPKNDKLKVQCIKMELGEPDESGRKKPIPVKGSEFIIELDRLIIAIGQKSEVPESFNIKTDKKGKIIVDEKNLSTFTEGVFAGGDLVSGPASVIEAVQHGRIAASSIDKYLGGDGVIEQKFIPDEEENQYIGREERFTDRKRANNKKLPIEKRKTGFSQVEFCLTEKEAVLEAERCLKCQLRLCLEKPPLPPKPK
jgi:formate dehydrogenase beta subunit